MVKPVIDSDQHLEKLISTSLANQRDLIKDLPKGERKLAEEYITDRSGMISSMLANGNFIFNTPLNSYLDNLFLKILNANADIDPTTTLLLSRSGSVNAFTTGDGFLILNLGLLAQLKSESELAFIMGHELSHQSLDHVNQSLREKAELEADPERIKEINRILRSEYQVSTKLNEIILPGMIASRQFYRKREYEADSLGYLFATRSGFSPAGSVAALEILDSVDVSLYGKQIPWQFLYESMECNSSTKFENISTESSLGSFDIIDQELVSQLRTHPDCGLRLPAGYTVLSPQKLGYYVKSTGNFDYNFTSKNPESDSYHAIYTDYNRKDDESEQKVDAMVGSINIVDGKMNTERIPVNTEASFIWFSPAKPGYILVNEYFRKGRKYKMRLEKITI